MHSLPENVNNVNNESIAQSNSLIIYFSSWFSSRNADDKFPPNISENKNGCEMNHSPESVGCCVVAPVATTNDAKSMLVVCFKQSMY